MAEKDIYSAGLVIVGNEILSGRTQDTNTQWVAEKLTARGIMLSEVRIIPDVEDEIVGALRDVKDKYDYIFTTGGIGPTHDDITAECVAKAFGLELEQNDEAFRMLEEHYGVENLDEARLKMARVPVGSKLIPNPVSSAPGFVVENVHVMAGVPRIMQAMLDHILSTIEAGHPILSNTVACSLQESVVASDLSQLQEDFPSLTVGSYPHYRGGVLGLSIVIRGTNQDILEDATKKLVKIIEGHGDEPRALSVRAFE